MPELPEVEVLVRHLGPLLKNKTIQDVLVRRPKVLAPTTEKEFVHAIKGRTFTGVERRGKYLLFALKGPGRKPASQFTGHLGMTGRIYLATKDSPMPKHAAVILDLGKYNFVYEDTRYFGRLTLDTRGHAKLGPEPLGRDFTVDSFAESLKNSNQAVKIKLLDQTLVAGIGNIYASEALYRARISPLLPAKKLSRPQIKALHRTIRQVLTLAIRLGSTVPLDFTGASERDKLFYYGRAESAADFYEERLMVYDREGKPCRRCRTPIKRITQAARSTFFCPHCQVA